MNAWATITAVRHTSASLQKRADLLLHGRGLTLTQVEILMAVNDRRRTYAGRLARDVRITRQGARRHLLTLERRGAATLLAPGDFTRDVELTPAGAELLSAAFSDLGPLFAGLAQIVRGDLPTIPPLLAGVENAARRPLTSAWGR